VRNPQVRNFRHPGRRPGLNVVPPPGAAAKHAAAGTAPAFTPHGADLDEGIEVLEEELGTISAQRVYKMRCGCGRSWFELELKKLVTCPACRKLGLVTS
jgi:hypothetical protein